jgi:hypothetical protein
MGELLEQKSILDGLLQAVWAMPLQLKHHRGICSLADRV